MAFLGDLLGGNQREEQRRALRKQEQIANQQQQSYNTYAPPMLGTLAGMAGLGVPQANQQGAQPGGGQLMNAFLQATGNDPVAAPAAAPAAAPQGQGGSPLGGLYGNLMRNQWAGIERGMRSAEGGLLSRLQGRGMLNSGQAQNFMATLASQGQQQMGDASARYGLMANQEEYGRQTEAMRMLANLLSGNQQQAASGYGNVGQGFGQMAEGATLGLANLGRVLGMSAGSGGGFLGNLLLGGSI